MLVLGIGTWLTASTVAPEAMIAANLLGLFASCIGMLMGILAPQLIAHRGHSIAAAIGAAQGKHAGRAPHH